MRQRSAEAELLRGRLIHAIRRYDDATIDARDARRNAGTQPGTVLGGIADDVARVADEQREAAIRELRTVVGLVVAHDLEGRTAEAGHSAFALAPGLRADANELREIRARVRPPYVLRVDAFMPRRR